MINFSLWLGIGASLGLWRIARSVPKRQSSVWVNAGLFVLFAALLGARTSYALVNWTYFSTHLIEIPMLWIGGLTWPGAVLGMLLALAYLSTQNRTTRSRSGSFGWLGDRLYPLLPPIAITAWLGCWQSGVAYGASLPLNTWWGVPAIDESGLYSPRWPVQLLAALSLLIFFWLLERRIKPLRPAGRLSRGSPVRPAAALAAVFAAPRRSIPRLEQPARGYLDRLRLADLLHFLLAHLRPDISHPSASTAFGPARDHLLQVVILI